MKRSSDQKFKSALLLGAQVLLIATSAFWEQVDPRSDWPVWLYSILFCAGGYVLAHSRRWLIAYLSLSIPALLIGATAESIFLISIHYACLSGAFLLLFRAILRHSLFSSGVSQADRILAGVAGYLLLGLFWIAQFGWATAFGAPNVAFLNHVTGEAAKASEMLYFSYVTLTTLGYGDIVPVTPVAKVLVVFNSLSGVLYLAVLVASLVGGLKGKE